MAKRLSKDEWAAARVKWESDKEATDTSIASIFGVSKQAVEQQRKKNSWQKVGALQNISERAQFAADNLSKLGLDKIKAETIDAAVEIRADVIDRHRGDWAEHRKLFTLSGIAENFELGKSAKITAEMLKIRQEAERKAYGLDDVKNTPNTSMADAMLELAKTLPR